MKFKNDEYYNPQDLFDAFTEADDINRQLKKLRKKKKAKHGKGGKKKRKKLERRICKLEKRLNRLAKDMSRVLAAMSSTPRAWWQEAIIRGSPELFRALAAYYIKHGAYLPSESDHMISTTARDID